MLPMVRMNQKSVCMTSMAPLPEILPSPISDPMPMTYVLDENGTIYISEYCAVTCLQMTAPSSGALGKTHQSQTMAYLLEMENSTMPWVLPLVQMEIYMWRIRNHRVQVLDKNGSFIRKFGTQGSAPGEFSNPRDLDFFSLRHIDHN